MDDELEGPYKVVAPIGGGVTMVIDGVATKSSQRPIYRIVKEDRRVLKEIVPDAGSAQTARNLCNLLNKQYKEKTDDQADGPDGAGVSSTDL